MFSRIINACCDGKSKSQDYFPSGSKNIARGPRLALTAISYLDGTVKVFVEALPGVQAEHLHLEKTREKLRKRDSDVFSF